LSVFRATLKPPVGAALLIVILTLAVAPPWRLVGVIVTELTVWVKARTGKSRNRRTRKRLGNFGERK
jgi:hypothetical protein